MCNAHATWAFVCALSHFYKECGTRPKLSKTKADLLSGSREQPGVGGAGREKEGGGTVAWRGGGKAHLEGGHLALKLRGLASRGDIAPNKS